MGNVPAAMLDCSCIEGVYKSLGTDSDTKAAQDRVEFLQRGSKFARKALLGLTSQEMFLKLSDDTSAVEWKTIGKASWTGGDEHGEIDLTTKIKTIKCTGTQGLSFIGVGADNDKSILEVQAESPAVRDQWLIALNELMQGWTSDPSTKPTHNDTAEKTSDKAAYFRKREEELAARIKENEEKKKKYSGGGMKHVAQAMMNRS